MLSLKNRGGSVKAEIPKALYMAIVRVQAAESLDWAEACNRAATLLDANSESSRRRLNVKQSACTTAAS